MPRVQEAKPATVTIRLSEPMRAWVEKRSAKLGITVSEYLRLSVLNEMKAALDR